MRELIELAAALASPPALGLAFILLAPVALGRIAASLGDAATPAVVRENPAAAMLLVTILLGMLAVLLHDDDDDEPPMAPCGVVSPAWAVRTEG